MNSANLTLAAYTHFGARGLKGVGMYHLVNQTWKRGRLQKVIAVSKNRCQFEFDLHLVGTFPGGSRLINCLGTIKEKIWEGFPARLISEVIFDHYARLRLSPQRGFLITTPGMLRTTRKAKALGYTTVMYGGIPDPRYLFEQIRTEKDALCLKNVGNERERRCVMARIAAQVDMSDYIIAISEFAKETYIKHGFSRDKIYVAHLGVELEKFRWTVPPQGEGLTYLFVGHVNETTGPVKGLQYLLQAWAELNLGAAKLIVCGKMGEEAQSLVRKYDSRNRNVEFAGAVHDPAEYYQKASVLVFPSVTEGFGKVVLEAMASGRPVIATPIPRPVIREGVDGFYVQARDVEGLKQRMLYFYEHPEEVPRMGTNAAEQAKRFSWQRFSRQVADIVEEISLRERN
ncbi:MAG TPA: glycosyltransferase family 4 protein [Candidatus Binatia bacterium]|nr:glycosyltransferase family 4 protein [Candidatus Binatia bacterium]